MITNQSGNTAAKIVAGDNTEITNNIYSARHSPLAALYARLRSADESQNYTAKISEKLQHFCGKSSDGDIRGLTEKLTSANRSDLIALASGLKEDAAKIIMKYQTSPIAQDIITMVLSKIYTDFILNVRPAIEAGESRQVIDSLVSEKVLNPAMTMLGENDMMLTDADILGLLFYLGGNCHVRWDKC